MGLHLELISQPIKPAAVIIPLDITDETVLTARLGKHTTIRVNRSLYDGSVMIHNILHTRTECNGLEEVGVAGWIRVKLLKNILAIGVACFCPLVNRLENNLELLGQLVEKCRLAGSDVSLDEQHSSY